MYYFKFKFVFEKKNTNFKIVSNQFINIEIIFFKKLHFKLKFNPIIYIWIYKVQTIFYIENIYLTLIVQIKFQKINLYIYIYIYFCTYKKDNYSLFKWRIVKDEIEKKIKIY